jgi:hypothetical protein
MLYCSETYALIYYRTMHHLQLVTMATLPPPDPSVLAAQISARLQAVSVVSGLPTVRVRRLNLAGPRLPEESLGLATDALSEGWRSVQRYPGDLKIVYKRQRLFVAEDW